MQTQQKQEIIEERLFDIDIELITLRRKQEISSLFTRVSLTISIILLFLFIFLFEFIIPFLKMR